MENKKASLFKSLPLFLMIIYILLFGLFFSIAIYSMHFDIPVGNFTRDPIAILGGHPFIGVMSNIGILFWSATAAICIFASKIYLDKTEFSTFLFFSGLLTLLLLFDDLFQLHERIDNYLYVHEYTAYVIYFILISIYSHQLRHDGRAVARYLKSTAHNILLRLQNQDCARRCSRRACPSPACLSRDP